MKDCRFIGETCNGCGLAAQDLMRLHQTTAQPSNDTALHLRRAYTTHGPRMAEIRARTSEIHAEADKLNRELAQLETEFWDYVRAAAFGYCMTVI